MKRKYLLLILICILCIIPSGVKGATVVIQDYGAFNHNYACRVRYSIDYSFADNTTTYVATIRYYFTFLDDASSCRFGSYNIVFYPSPASTSDSNLTPAPANASAIFSPTTYNNSRQRYSVGITYGERNTTATLLTYTLTWNKTHTAQALDRIWVGICSEPRSSITSCNTSSENFVYFTKPIGGNITVPAKPSYAVTYYANGGSGAPGAQTKWYGENLTLSTTKPTRTGYTFDGWNTKADGTGTDYPSGLVYSANAALTLYAKWTPNKYTVKYNSNGGTGEVPDDQLFSYDETKNLSSNPFTKTNNRFKGWNTKADGTGTNYANGASVKNLSSTDNGVVTLYANWASAVVTLNGSEITKDEQGRYVIYNSQKEKYKKQFGIKIYNDNFNTDVVIRDSECENLWLDEGTYKIKEIFTDEYRLERVTGLSGNDGTLTVESDQEYNIKFHNKYYKNDSYVHSYGRVENKIEAS